MMRLLRRLWFLIKREDDLADEIEFHRQMKADELRAKGVADADIAAAARRAMGNDLLARERARDVWVSPWLQDISQDVRFGLRVLLKERRFAITAVVTLSLGIAVSNAVFMFVNATIFRALPFASPERLLTIRTLDPRGFQTGVSLPEFREWQRGTTVFESLSADLSESVNVSDANHSAARLSGAFVTHETFRTLGITPILGRDFAADDDREGAAPVVLLSHDLWLSRYAGDPGVVGRVIRINERPSTVIGVMPERFSYPLVAEVWLPMAQSPNARTATWVSTPYGIAGRLKPSADLPHARAEIEAIAARTLREHPEVSRDRKLAVMNLKDATVALDAKSLLLALFGGAIVVLCVASANVANLQLARSWHRSRETAVRLAMGATRWRVIRQVLVECVLLGTAGSVLGAYLSFFGIRALSSAFNVLEAGALDRPRKVYWFDASVDGTGWLFLGAVFLFASLAAGLIPAMHMSKGSANDVLKDGRLGHATRVSRRWASALMIGQLAVALILLACGGLLARSFVSLYNTDPVIDVHDIITMRLTLPVQKYATPEARQQFVRLLDERLVSSALFTESAIGSTVPLQPFGATSRLVSIDDGREADTASLPRVTYVNAGPRFFETLRFPIVRGRALTSDDDRSGSEGVVLNQRAASVLFGDVDPLGMRIRLTIAGAATGTTPRTATIVGVAPTVPDFLWPNRPGDPVIYAPLLSEEAPPRGLSVMVRSSSEAAAAAALREQVRSLDADLPVHQILTLEEMLSLTRSGARMVGSWFQALAVIAVVLACVGLYALTAHGVAQRTQEIGVRMALGAQPRQVSWLFVRHTLVLLAVGVSLGIAGALAFTRLLASFLGGIDPRDPLTFVIVTLALTGVAMLAALVPARRAAKVDPIVALRAD